MASNAITILIQAKDQASPQVRKIGTAVDALNGHMRDNKDAVDKANGSWFKTGSLIGAAAGVVQTVASRAFSELNGLIDDAVSRVDTLNNFPRVLENFGVSAKDSSRMIQTLDKGVRGLPTTLNSIAMLAQGFVPLTKNTDEAAQTALALNNAILAGGTPAQVQAAAFEQFRQALAKGVPDLQDWKSLETAMPAQLSQTAEKLGLGSGALAEYARNGLGLYNAMKDGKLTMADFDKALRDLNEHGINGLPNLAQQAKNATGGIATGFELAKTAAVRGIAAIIQAIGSKNISSALHTLASGIDLVFGALAGLVKIATPLVPLFVGIGAALLGYKAAVLAANAVTAIHSALIYLMGTRYVVVNGAIIAVRGAVTAATVAQGAWNAVMAMNPIGLLVGAIAGLVTILALSSSGTDSATDSVNRLNAARQQQADIAEAAKQKENELRDASLGVEGANLRLEHATRDYNDAVAQYGPNSLQARDAAYQLKQANNDLSSATEDLNKKQQDQLITLAQLNTDLDKLNGKNVTYTINGNNVGAWKQNGQAFFGGNFATGTPYAPGGLTLVGERGPELVNLPTGSKVSQAYRTRQELSQSTGATINEYGTYIFNNQQDWDAQEARRDQTARLAVRGMA